jgi:hypothetical protein
MADRRGRDSSDFVTDNGDGTRIEFGEFACPNFPDEHVSGTTEAAQ